MHIETLQRDAKAIRKILLTLHHRARSGHIGSGLSCVDLLAFLYRSWLRNAGSPDGDVFILSKGHAASALYATLSHFGHLPEELLAQYYGNGTILPAHPAPGALPHIPAATGSLGHGLPIATGLAFAEKVLAKGTRRIACLVSDGECNEGSIWEAALFAGHHALGNLTVIVDANGLQGFGRTEEVLNLEPLADKWRAFGFRVIELEGHDFSQMQSRWLATAAAAESSPPTVVIARTVKGKGVPFMEDRLEWHYQPMSDEQYAQALRALRGEADDAR